MSIKISHGRAVIGFDITVEVTTTGDERLTYVGTTFDGRRIGHAVTRPPASSYTRTFRQQGGWCPGTRHLIIVTVITDKARDSAVHEWQD
jgi:hypothetical protein